MYSNPGSVCPIVLKIRGHMQDITDMNQEKRREGPVLSNETNGRLDHKGIWNGAP